MSKKVDSRRRDDSPLDGLARLLETPHLAQVVPHLPSEALFQLVRHRGVDGCAELLAAATPAQLASVLDLDLWQRQEAGGDERFDPARFGEWLEGLVESGDSYAATIVARLDPRLVTAALAAHVRVFDMAATSPDWSREDDGFGADGDSAAVQGPSCELGGYVLRARSEQAWDALVAVLLALEAEHPHYFHAVMAGCRRLSNSRPELDGAHELLQAPQQLLHDLGLGREQRRSGHGYLSAADARAFLEMARRPAQDGGLALSPNPIAAAYLRQASAGSAEENEESTGADAPPSAEGHQPPADDSKTDPEIRRTVDQVAVLLAELSLAAERPRGLLAAPAQRQSRPLAHELMEQLRETDEEAFLARTRELAFLANALMAGCSIQARPFTPQEASDAALATCSLGLEQWPAGWPDAGDADPAVTSGGHAKLSAGVLGDRDHDMVIAFQVGWRALHAASLGVARELIDVLGGVHALDSPTQQGLVALRRDLVRHCEAAAPWRARNALDVLAILDTPTWSALLGALDECPALPEILVALVERRRGAVSATAFEFVSSTGQLSVMQEFGRRLASLLR